MEAVTKQMNKTHDMVYIGIFAVLIAICSWISIPAAVPFTLQTMGVFLSVGILGGKRGTLAVLVYLLLGAVGIPVFVFLQSSGGYLAGFLLSALLMWGMEKLLGRSTVILGISMVLGLLVCYAAGTIWFMAVYTANTGAIGVGTVLAWCVIPFILPDLVKIAVALVLTKRLAGVVRR